MINDIKNMYYFQQINFKEFRNPLIYKNKNIHFNKTRIELNKTHHMYLLTFPAYFLLLYFPIAFLADLPTLLLTVAAKPCCEIHSQLWRLIN